MTLSTPVHGLRGRSLRAGLAGLACILLAGCANDRNAGSPPAIHPYDRHPITLVEGDRTIEIFAAGGGRGIGTRQQADIRAFAAEYRRNGHGPFYMAVPIGNPKAARTAGVIAGQLRAAGVRPVRAAYETAGDPGSVAPVKLTFGRMQARVATRCGRWTDDVGGYAGNFESWNNQPYRDFGCSSQQMLAQQVADPLDLVRSRPEAPPNTARATTVLMNYRTGKKTSVDTPDKAQAIGDGVEGE